MTLITSTIGENSTTNREDSLSDKSKTKYYNKPHLVNNDNFSAPKQKLSRRFIAPQYQHTQTYCSQGDISKRRQCLTNMIDAQTKRKEYKKQNYDRSTSIEQKNKWFGNKMVRHKGWDTGEYSDTIRICTININGIAQDMDWIEWDTTLRSMYSQQIDILGVTEPNINFKNMHVKSKLYDIAKSFERNTQFSTSCSNQLRSAKKKQGGTMTILSGRWAGRKQGTKSDSLGRWSSMTLVGKKERKVTVITAYRVCQQKGGDGCTVYHQQQLDFEQRGKRMINLRKQFCIDMVQYVRSLHEQRQIVILMGDFNEDFNQSGNQINTMLKDCGLVNVYTKVHGDKAKQPNTYDRGTKCLDTIAITDSAQIPQHSIKGAGFMPFYHEFCSDHRAVYCDLDTKILFGNIRIDPMNSSMRPFTTKNIKQCNKFKENVRKLYRKSKIFQNVKSLQVRFEKDSGEELLQTIEECKKLSEISSQLLLSAGRKVGKRKYTKGKPYSAELNKIARKYHTEKSKLRYLKTTKSQSLSKNEEETTVLKIKSAYKELRKVQREADIAREKFLREIAEKRAGEWNLSTAGALNIIIQSEASKRTYARHGSVMKPTNKGSISSLMVPVPQYRETIEETKKVEWTEIDDDATIFQLLLKRNAQQLMRSAQSPFATGTLVEECGYDGEKKMAVDLLNGTLSKSDMSQILNENKTVENELDVFIRALAKPKDSKGDIVQDFSWKYGVQEFRSTFRKTRESTACGPSGLNMSYWKACAEDDDIAQVQAFFIEKAFHFGFSYKRWQTSWHCMLKKDEIPYLHRLRIIQLFEGDFNGALKYLLGRLLMYHVVKKKQCDEQAFGSIPGRTAHGALITLQLLYDNARVTKKTTASIFNDAAGCYDRIRSLLSYLCMVRVGCPEGIAQCHSITQREMVHHVKTCRGASINNIQWGPNLNLYTKERHGVKTTVGNIGGIGQGGGGSPVGWLAVLLVMIQTYSKFTSGVQLSDPLGLYTLSLFLISYVDDNTLVQSFGQDETMPSILAQLQICLSKWHNILKITGGDLALEKCTFSIMKWKWSGYKATLETLTTAPGTITVNGTNIQRLEADRGTRVLGVRMAMNGSFKDELEYRQKQSKTMANTLYKSWLSTTDAYMVYETRFCPALEYPLPVTMFSKREMESIQKPFVHLLLPKIGMNRHTPLAVVHGPHFRGGLGIRNLEEQQVCKHFETFQGHVRRQDNLGVSYRIQLITQQVEAGCGQFFLNTNPNIYSYVTPRTRLGYLWRQCYRYSITVTMSQMWIPAGYQGNDMTIMDYIVPLFPAERKNRTYLLQRINACRLYLRLMWVRDLFVSPDSLVMDTDIINGNKINMNGSLDFPAQSRPSPKDFTLWKDCVHRSLCNYRYNEATGRAVVKSRLLPIPDTRDYMELQSDYRDILATISLQASLESKFDNLPQRFKDIIGDITLPSDNGEQLISSLKSGTAALASDGSYMEDQKKGTHAYILVSCDCDHGNISGAATSPDSDCMSSSPTEQYGAIATLVVLIVLLYHHNEDGYLWPTVKLYIDNSEVVDRGGRINPIFRNVGQYLTHDYDLWMVMSNLQENMRLPIEFEWVRGHQSIDMGNEQLMAVLLNTEVDRLATLQYEKRQKIPQRGAFISGVVCLHQLGFHVQNIYNAVTARESDKLLLDYYKSRGWHDHCLELVDWRNMGNFLKKCHPIERCNTIQSMHDWQNTGYQKRCFQKSTTVNMQDSKVDESIGLCPLHCGLDEVPFHYMHCRSSIVCKAREEGKATLTKALQKMNTAPSLLEAIIKGLSFWEDETEYNLDEKSNKFLFNELHTRLLTNQNKIGWERFAKGYVTKEWGLVQSHYYIHLKGVTKRNFSRDAWTTQLIRLLHHYRASIWRTRNQVLHGGINKEQRLHTRAQMIIKVRELYKKNRSNLPYKERDIFHLPLGLRVKQGAQQLLLWIQRAELLFKTYKETPLTTGQQQRITEWLDTWYDAGNTRTRQQNDMINDNTYYIDSGSETDCDEARGAHSQTNITNWVKSWSNEDDSQGSVSTLCGEFTALPDF